MARELWQANLDEPCPYLPGLEATTDCRILTEVSLLDHERLIERGWRRFGLQYFRPECAGCDACVSLRLPVAAFRPTKSQRRAARKCAHLQIKVGPPQVTDERLALFGEWHAMREGMRGWKPTVMNTEEYAATFCPPNLSAWEMTYYDGGRLVAVGMVDVTVKALSSVYFYYHPEIAPCSPGVASVLFEVEWARQRACEYVYLGYRVLGCPSTAYKSQYGPHELLVGRPRLDEEPAWVG